MSQKKFTFRSRFVLHRKPENRSPSLSFKEKPMPVQGLRFTPALNWATGKPSSHKANSPSAFSTVELHCSITSKHCHCSRGTSAGSVGVKLLPQNLPSAEPFISCQYA